MLNTEAVEWMVGYYFTTQGRFTEDNIPEFVVNMSKQELMYFIYQFSESISPKKRGAEASPKNEICKILTQCFEDMFGNNADTLSTRLKRETRDYSSTGTAIIDEAVKKFRDQEAKARKKRHAKE